MFSPTLCSLVLTSVFFLALTVQSAAQTSCPEILNYFPRVGYPGYGLTIQGRNLTGVTAVSFSNGALASFEILSDREIAVTVPLNAGSGPITISKTGCPDIASGIFTIPPPPMMDLTPESQILMPGKTGQVTVNFRSGLFVPATIQIESTNPAGVMTPSAILLPPGTTSVKFDVEAITPGAVATITVSLPPNLGSVRATTMVSVDAPVLRPVRFPAVAGKAGGALFLPIHLNGRGDENAIRFSLSYDPLVLSNLQASLGMSLGAGTISVDRSQTDQGRVGIVLEYPAGFAIPAGDKQILLLRFDIAASALGGAAQLAFGDLPTARRINSIAGEALPASFTAANVTIESSQVELALSPQSQSITAGGSAQISVRITKPASAPIMLALSSSQPEAVTVPAFVTIPQEATSAVFTVSGITAGVAATITATMPADLGGATASAGVQVIAPVVRVVKIPGAAGPAGGSMWIPIEINAQGDEGAIGFSLAFDANLLGQPQVSLGMSLVSGTITLFTDPPGNGRIGILLSFPPGEPLPAGNKQILLVRFSVAAGAPAGETAVGFIDQPTMRTVLSAGGTTLPASFLSVPVKIER
jgi:hypothetical protein